MLHIEIRDRNQELPRVENFRRRVFSQTSGAPPRIAPLTNGAKAKIGQRPKMLSMLATPRAFSSPQNKPFVNAIIPRAAPGMNRSTFI